ncbi:MAG: methylmalonyl-CoA carboxyltransferase [Oscillospiraceae bacterium]|nr:methylmalonyl-CoA carboxyltransferase [Oscillospiraceae bacterium]
MDLQKRLEFVSETQNKIFGAPEPSGKKTARERLAMLFDEGTFVETGAYIKKRPNEFPEAGGTSGKYEGIVAGYGSIGGRLVFAYSQDFSKMSGALSEAGVKKILSVYSMAEKNGAPVVSIFDSSGADVTEGIDVLSGYGAIISKATILSGIVPQYSAICGTCGGGAAIIASISDFVFIEKANGKIFIAPPFVVKSLEECFDGEIGGAELAAKLGQCAKVIKGEEALFASLCTLIEYVPSNNFDENVYLGIEDDANRLCEGLSDLIQSENYDIRKLIAEIADNHGFFELYESYCPNMVCGFVSMANMTVGVVANQPSESGGAICPGACDKAARFIYVCDHFNIPILTLVDTKGMAVSKEAENSQFALYAAKLAFAYASASAPKITLNIGGAIGSAYTIMGSKGLGADIVLAYPAAQISILAPDTAVELLYGEQIAKDPEPAKKREELLAIWEIEKSSPVEAASGGAIDNIIEPSQTRQLVISALYLLQSKREIRPVRGYKA